MVHLPHIIEDLALILVAAAFFNVVFRKIGQPVVLGYIIAGALIGPHFSWAPNVADGESVKVWAEIGVIFLLFALGLEFSFKKLARVGPSASITAIVEVLGMLGIGYLLGRSFGWGAMDSIFLGGILSISSTTIIIRAFDELGMKTRGFVRLVFGILIIEDLVAILLLAALTTIAASNTVSGGALALAGGKLVFFLTLWFVLGIFLVPSFFQRIRANMKSETLLIISIGLCFLMVVLASQVGFSPALGAFIMGSILAETLEGERIEHLIEPVKDLFAAIFFVSVGMLINPQILMQYAGPIVAITLVTIVGKALTTTVGALVSGQSLRHSVQSGMSLAQIGEFSFIIAALGLSLKATSDFLYPIAISVSAVTTFTTPYLIRLADPLVHWLERHLPRRVHRALESFHVASGSPAQASDWQILQKRLAIKMGTNGVVVVAIFLLADLNLYPWILQQTESLRLSLWVSLAIAFVLSAPFIWAMAFGRLQGPEVKALWRDPSNKTALLVYEVMRWVIAISLTAALASRFVSAGKVLLAVSSLLIIIVFILSRHLEKPYRWLESRFFSNLNEKEQSTPSRVLPKLAPWDSHLVELTVSPDSPLAGRKLSDAMIRERFGVTVALIERGSRIIPAPRRDEQIFPGDQLQVIGTDEQITRFKAECEQGSQNSADFTHLDYALHPVFVGPSSPYAGKTIRECGLREKTHGLVVGIEKSGKRTLNPDSTTLIEGGDVLWVVADLALITEHQ
ncbi:MAG: cation:proton antiporter [Bdellovibrionales bacterium]|nr:cation:proton antiporter [Bdellovibrionales bacterium]